MKKVFLISIFLLFISNLIAQNKISLILKDGSTINGFGRIKTNDEILYKKTEDSEKQIFNYKTVRKLIVYTDDYEQNYEYRVNNDTGKVKLLEIILVGKVNLFKHVQGSGAYTPNSIGGGFDFTAGSYITYYISKNENNISVTSLGIGNTYSKRFKTTANEFFNSCPDVLEKINNKYFNRYGVEAVVEYFIDNCD
jgi:hypothetical protein